MISSERLRTWNDPWRPAPGSGIFGISVLPLLTGVTRPEYGGASATPAGERGPLTRPEGSSLAQSG